MATKIFLDANVVLDYVLKRNHYLTIRELFVLAQESKIRFYISSSIVHILGYILTKHLGYAVAKTTILKLLDSIQVIDGNHATTILALLSENPDIEDALQFEIAHKNKMDFFITLDKKFQKF